MDQGVHTSTRSPDLVHVGIHVVFHAVLLLTTSHAGHMSSRQKIACSDTVRKLLLYYRNSSSAQSTIAREAIGITLVQGYQFPDGV